MSLFKIVIIPVKEGWGFLTVILFGIIKSKEAYVFNEVGP